MSEQYLRLEKEQIYLEVSLPNRILRGKFTKDKGIRFTDYFNRDRTKQKFIVLSDVEVLDINTTNIIGQHKFLALNVEFIVTATELEKNSTQKY